MGEGQNVKGLEDTVICFELPTALVIHHRDDVSGDADPVRAKPGKRTQTVDADGVDASVFVPTLWWSKTATREEGVHGRVSIIGLDLAARPREPSAFKR